MHFDLMTEVKAAVIAISQHTAGVELLTERYTDDGDLDGYLVWVSKRTQGWGEWAEVRLSPDLKHLFVVADEYQPWGTGMDVSWRVAKYSADDVVTAIRHAILVSESDFSLDGLSENEDTGQYERHVYKPQIQLAV